MMQHFAGLKTQKTIATPSIVLKDMNAGTLKATACPTRFAMPKQYA
ncbi:hypothetical protein OESDEN_16781 [Oesophagostomum dentatum]|uniref:Uncharacterized protein n=1 Tax=Oesophagostomum dentatum TaxID=61180 RepID=A0A0B1SJW5_OESDE|nr:hypothetical protein OESDEN_16781 [Oesophagostomum dentatum]